VTYPHLIVAGSGPPQHEPVNIAAPTPQRKRLGDILLSRGMLTPETLDDALRAQRIATGSRRRLGQIVVDLKLVSEKHVAEALGDLLGLEVVDLARHTVPPELARLLPRSVAERTLMLVLDRVGDKVLIASADPTNVVALDDVRLYAHASELTVVVALESQLREQLNRAWSFSEDTSFVSDVVEEMVHDATEGTGATEAAEASSGAGDAPIVRLVSMLLTEAVRARASDIHIEPQRDGLKVRYRVDGVLREVMAIPKGATPAVVSRLKIISGIDIAERRVPQDGRTKVVVDGKGMDARVSTLPSIHGEKVVIRLLSRADTIPDLTTVGLDPRDFDTLASAITTPQGLVLITGPTGSGKTNTLYAAIGQILSPEINIVTLEDPVEIQVAGITQVQVQERSGMTFGRGLRAILRQDPDVVLVGEVRDTETAELALAASLTGHLVLTTLHTNSAPAALTRLVDMGVQPFMVSSSLTCVVAQRLVRRPCQECVAPHDPDPMILEALGLTSADLRGATPVSGAGCPDCGDSGYRGRKGVFEVLNVDSAMRRLITTSPTEGAITDAAVAAGMTTLREAAIKAAMAGSTTFEEALRISPRD
jgi:type IV pilus assembly protein PilB